MTITMKKITIWRGEFENRQGALADLLEPLARAGADLQVVMGYRYPGDESRAAIEVYPVTGKKMMNAARDGGLQPFALPALLVEGDNKPGLGSRFARAISDSRINMAFLVTQTIGRKYSAIFGFETEADLKEAMSVMKRVERSSSRKPPRRP